MFSFHLEFQTMDIVQKPNDFEETSSRPESTRFSETTGPRLKEMSLLVFVPGHNWA
jgi:hypothetical protein